MQQVTSYPTTPYLEQLRSGQIQMFDGLRLAWRPDTRAEWKEILPLYARFLASMMDRELAMLHRQARRQEAKQETRRLSRHALYALRFRAE